jgi:alkaline phosphatase
MSAITDYPTLIRLKLFVSVCGLIFSCYANAQKILIHSHNDYRQRLPFYQAYAQQLASIEADIYITDKEDELLVAHDQAELGTAPTLDESYIEPIVSLYQLNQGRAWRGSDRYFVLLIDLKTPADTTLGRLIRKLQKYPEVFDPAVNPYAVRVVISGNRPDADTFHHFPSIISFDGSLWNYTPQQLDRIFMISLNFRNYSRWNGQGNIQEDELQKLNETIAAIHALGKPVRFWGCPDVPNAWPTFHQMGIDYINTDQPEACAAFFRHQQ